MDVRDRTQLRVFVRVARVVHKTDVVVRKPVRSGDVPYAVRGRPDGPAGGFRIDIATRKRRSTAATTTSRDNTIPSRTAAEENATPRKYHGKRCDDVLLRVINTTAAGNVSQRQRERVFDVTKRFVLVRRTAVGPGGRVRSVTGAPIPYARTVIPYALPVVRTRSIASNTRNRIIKPLLLLLYNVFVCHETNDRFTVSSQYTYIYIVLQLLRLIDTAFQNVFLLVRLH